MNHVIDMSVSETAGNCPKQLFLYGNMFKRGVLLSLGSSPGFDGMMALSSGNTMSQFHWTCPFEMIELTGHTWGTSKE
jgi:hypothetical protein